jgi:hypothetical protein
VRSLVRGDFLAKLSGYARGGVGNEVLIRRPTQPFTLEVLLWAVGEVCSVSDPDDEADAETKDFISVHSWRQQ